MVVSLVTRPAESKLMIAVAFGNGAHQWRRIRENDRTFNFTIKVNHWIVSYVVCSARLYVASSHLQDGSLSQSVLLFQARPLVWWLEPEAQAGPAGCSSLLQPGGATPHEAC